MGRRVLVIVILVAAAAFSYYYYRHHQDETRLANGEVTCDGCMTPEEHARFLRESAGETSDSQAERRAKAPLTDEAKTAAINSTTSGDAVVSAATTSTTQPTLPTPVAQGSYVVGSNAVAAAPPTSDTVVPNPTNGMVFGGKGTYQWYRQGNLTWRVDTTSGRSCIIYATMEEWRKQIVISHGCGRTA